MTNIQYSKIIYTQHVYVNAFPIEVSHSYVAHL
jgi:hypothetical protein